jgi:hypothetical protein
MKSILKEPLFHFLVLAVGLFGLHSAVSHEDNTTESKRIVVDRENLLTFIQYRTKVFQPDAAAARLESLSETALQRVIDDYVREEALHREAIALGLGRDDYVIKRRLVQKIDFVTQGFGEALVNPGEEQIQSYFIENKQAYYIQPTLTFTHVFFSAQHGKDKALQLAAAKLKELNANNVPFSDAAKHGEHFLYGMNYVERSQQYLDSHFGKTMSRAIFELDNDERWHGPFISEHGVHLVMVAGKKAGHYPQLAEVRNRVEQELRRAQIRQQANELAQQIVDTYEIDVKYEHNKKVARLNK